MAELVLAFQGGPHPTGRFVLPEEMDHYPELYTYRGEVYEKTLIRNHSGELIYVYKGPEPEVPEPDPDAA